MNNLFTKLFATYITACCLFFLFACSTTNKTATFTPTSSKENKAIVYLYRPFAVSNAIYSPDLYVNEEIRFQFKTNSKYLLMLPPGETTFEIAPDKNYSGTPSVVLNLAANNVYYLRLDTSLKIKSALNYEPYQREFSLINIEAKIAEREIAECCITEKKPGKKIKPEVVDKKPDEGFSVDKTQNPFSH